MSSGRRVEPAVGQDALVTAGFGADLSLAARFATPLVRKPASLSFVRVLGPPGPALVRFTLVCVSVSCFV